MVRSSTWCSTMRQQQSEQAVKLPWAFPFSLEEKIIEILDNISLFSAFPLLCLPERVNLLLGDDSRLLSCALLRLQGLHFHLQLRKRKGLSSFRTNKGHTTVKIAGDHDVLHRSHLSRDTDMQHNSSCAECRNLSEPCLPLQALLPSPTFSPR